MIKKGYWIRKPTEKHNGLTVYEVKCPFCKYCETYHDKAPKTCYVCGAELKIKD